MENNSVGFDSSRLNTHPGGTMKKIGDAVSTLSGSQARSAFAAKMAKAGGRTPLAQKKFLKKKARKAAVKKLVAGVKFREQTKLRSSVITEGSRVAREDSKANIATANQIKRDKSAITRSNTVTSNAEKVEAAKQKTLALKNGKPATTPPVKKPGAPKPARPIK